MTRRPEIRAVDLTVRGESLTLLVADPNGVKDAELLPNGWLAVEPWNSDASHRTWYPPSSIDRIYTFEAGRLTSDRYVEAARR